VLSSLLAHARLLGVAALILAVFCLIEFAGDELLVQLEFQRQAVLQGEVWRLWTGNLTHFGDYHTWMNAAGLAALVAVLFWYLPVSWFAAGVVVIPFGVGISLFLFAQDVGIYRGFSGANYGLLAMGLLLALPQQPKLYMLAFCVLLGKIVYEQLPGYDVDYLRGQIGVPVAIEAHLAGFCSGTFIGCMELLRRRLVGHASDH
jgi:rhomboid family GlyGly-CTERM serine protease